jgi:cytidine deaminase
VGAAVESETGEIFVGCNVEIGSFGLTMCAERVAVGAAVVAGHRRLVRLAISTDGEAPVPPCGGCRQVLSEFGPDLEVISEAGGEQVKWRLADIFPEPFVFRGSGGGTA